MKRYLIAIFCLAGPLSSAQEGQGPWSLQDCVDYALEHNITIRQSEVALEQKEIELNTAKNRRLPGLNASVSENLSFGRGLTADNTYTNSNTTSTSSTSRFSRASTSTTASSSASSVSKPQSRTWRRPRMTFA